MKFLPKYLTKMYKFWIKSVVLYPKMYIWSRKKICTFYTKNEVFAKKFHLNVQSLDKNCSFVPKNVHLVPKTKKIVLFTLKMKFLPKYLTKMYKFWIETVVLYPKMYIWSWNIKKNCTFYTKYKVFAKKFH